MGTLTDSVTKALDEMNWLTPADKAARALALAYADQIDSVLDGDQKCPECEQVIPLADSSQVTKALYLGPHLLNALRALGGTPEGRSAIDVSEEVKGALSGIRNKRAAART